MKKVLFFALISVAILYTSISTSSLVSYKIYDLANNEEPYPGWTKD
ncbi:hypothetical protein H8S33_11565 [Ornithinibacillus sp. BX22]|uniref:Uncharacterized protein n=2 Tax=Ornithinibacillus TaxID=484508 RepID=A0A923RIT1_9BACI|nr:MULTISPECIES: hypothetical protein [Ornithinibacillus]MBC5637444.1 hypothetical protein [Ornithinibacillus hominis]MBS3680248.1 hypothetical protein [Ornithinibacillus massiliensis]